MTIRQTILCTIALSAVACDRGKPAEPTLQGGATTVEAPAPQMERDMSAQRASKGFAGAAAVMSAGVTNESENPPVVASQPETATPAMMIRTGYSTLEVSRLDPAIEQVRALAGKVGGYITNTSTTGGRDQVRGAMLEIRIPAPRYDEAVAALTAIGRVEVSQTSAQDVGEDFVDMTARVENARKLETRLIELLANRTGRLQDVLAVERELARVRTEIDQIEGRLRFLKNRVALSTLTVNLHEPQPLIGNTPGESPISAAVRQAWRNFVGFLASIIASLGIVIPLATLGLLVWFWFRRWRKRR